WHQVDGVDGRLRHERPVDGVAEGIVQAHAVLVDGEALRQTEQRRSDEAAVLQVRLQRVVLRVVDMDARELPAQVVREIDRTGGGKVLGVGRLHVARYAGGFASCAERSGADDLDRVDVLLRERARRGDGRGQTESSAESTHILLDATSAALLPAQRAS